MKTLHTPEPWFCDGDAIYNNVDCTGDPIAHVLTMPFDDAGNACDARRIVACVNACAGIENGTLEKLGFGGARKVPPNIRKIEQQRDQLLAALEELRDFYQDCTSLPACAANAAIAAVKKGGAA